MSPEDNQKSVNHAVDVLTKLMVHLDEFMQSKAPDAIRTKDIFNEIDNFNRSNNLLDYGKTIFRTEDDEEISHEIQQTYQKINTDAQFLTVVQICDCNNANLVEHLWSLIMVVHSIIHQFDLSETRKSFYFEDFKYFIFLNLLEQGKSQDRKKGLQDTPILNLLKQLIKTCRLENNFEIIPLFLEDDLDNVLYQLRQDEKLSKIDLMLLLDEQDINNLLNLKIVETLGLIQPNSFIISISQNLVYSRYVGYSPWQKNMLLKASGLLRKHPGRWNLVYETKCLMAEDALGVELTRCIEYLDG